ncbi:hypothetical protein Ancab_004077 [Ancistrocladus abbreviatus]
MSARSGKGEEVGWLLGRRGNDCGERSAETRLFTKPGLDVRNRNFSKVSIARPPPSPLSRLPPQAGIRALKKA